jgi:DNA repair exonuclease SbcCD ATPase subunit
VTIPVPLPPAPATQVQTLSPEQIAQLQANSVALQERLDQEAAARAALEQRMAAFDTDLQTRQQNEQAAIQAATDAAEEKRQAELSFSQKLEEFQSANTQQVQSLQQQLAERDAVLERERQFTELMGHRNAVLQERGDDIIPELRDLVQGNTREEIDASVSALIARSGSILQNVAQQAQAVRQNARGVGVTAPPVGPMDTNSGQQTFTADDIRNMDMTQYAQHRARLLGAASQTSQRDRGMFG